MNSALKEIFAFFVFLILLMDVAQYHRNPDTFLLTKTLYETFEAVDAYGIDLSAVSKGEKLMGRTACSLVANNLHRYFFRKFTHKPGQHTVEYNLHWAVLKFCPHDIDVVISSFSLWQKVL